MSLKFLLYEVDTWNYYLEKLRLVAFPKSCQLSMQINPITTTCTVCDPTQQRLQLSERGCTNHQILLFLISLETWITGLDIGHRSGGTISKLIVKAC